MIQKDYIERKSNDGKSTLYSKLNSDMGKTPNESNQVSSIENLVLLAK